MQFHGLESHFRSICCSYSGSARVVSAYAVALQNVCDYIYFKETLSLLFFRVLHTFPPTCGRMPLPALSLWPGRQQCRPRPVDSRRGGGPSSVAPRSRNPPTERALSR